LNQGLRKPRFDDSIIQFPGSPQADFLGPRLPGPKYVHTAAAVKMDVM